MVYAPQQNWSYIEARSRECDAALLRAMTPSERFIVYADMYNVIWSAHRTLDGNWERLDQHRWAEKLAIRKREVEAFNYMDQLRFERAAADNAN